MKKQNLPNRTFLAYFAMQTIFLIFLFVSNILPQVIINERVEINSKNQINAVNKIQTELCETYLPDSKTPSSGDNELYNVFYGNCEEGNWGQGMHCFHFLVLVTPVNVSVVEGSGYVLTKLWDPVTQTYSYPGSNFDITTQTTLDLIFNLQEPDSVARVTIVFTKTGWGTATYVYDVHKPIFHLVVDPVTGINDIDYGTEQLVKILGTNQCGRGPRIPSSVLYNAEIIEGDEFGQLHNPETGEYGGSLDSLHNSGRYIQDFYFVAYGTIPNQDEQITIRIETTDPEIDPIDVSFLVKPPQMVVSLDPSEISAGDTAQVVIMKREPDGTLVDFDSTQTFEIAKLEGCVLGDILVGSDSGAYFYNITQPIYFTVADSINGDSSQTVHLRIGLVEEGKSISKMKQQHLENYECFWDQTLSNIYQDKLFEVGPKIELIDYADDDFIEGNNPTMPEFPIQLKITNDTRGNFDFLRYYLFLEWKNIQQTGQPVYGGGVTKLEQLPPGGSPLIFDFNVDWDHTNPGFICGGDDLTLRVEYKGVKKDFKLNSDILGKNPTEKETFRTYVSTQLSEPKTTYMNITIYYESRFRQFKNDNYVYMNTDNLPKVDWGVCQVRKITPAIGEIWDWKENINSGIIIFEDKLLKAENYPKRVREGKTWHWYTDPTTGDRSRTYNDPLHGHYEWYPKAYANATDFNEEQLLKEMFQRYVSGVYWRWEIQDPNDLNSGKWVKSPSYPKNDRGDKAWDIKIGNYPSDWD